MSHTSTTASAAPVASRRALAENAIAITIDECVEKVRSGAPKGSDQIRTVESAAPEASVPPVGQNAVHITIEVWPAIQHVGTTANTAKQPQNRGILG
jgi:hypothetical protein